MRGDGNVAGPAQQSVILQAAFAAAVRNREDVIRFPSRPHRAPLPPCGAIRSRRPLTFPTSFCPPHVEATHAADPLIAFPDLFADVRRAAPQAPIMDARVAAEGLPARSGDEVAAPPANRTSLRIEVGFPVTVGRNGSAPDGAHARRIGRIRLSSYRRSGEQGVKSHKSLLLIS